MQAPLVEGQALHHKYTRFFIQAIFVISIIKLSWLLEPVPRALVLYVFIAVVHVGVVVKEELVWSDKRLTVDIINSGALGVQ